MSIVPFTKTERDIAARLGITPDGDTKDVEKAARAVVAVLRPLIEAKSLEIHAGIYQATPNRVTTYGDVGYQLSEHARLTRQEYDEARISAAARQSEEDQR